jgi:hypothetical protein
MENLARWSNKWKLDIKANKSCEVVFHARHRQPENHSQIYLKGEIIERSAFHKHLGFILDESLTFEQHIRSIIPKCNTMLNPLSKLKMSVKSTHLEHMYKAFILPHLEYGGII